MAISFEEFRRKVPKRTMDFLITILPFVDSYRRRGKNLDYVGSEVSNRPSNEYSTNFFLVLSFPLLLLFPLDFSFLYLSLEFFQ